MTTTRQKTDASAMTPALLDSTLPAVVGHDIATNVASAPAIGDFDDLDLDPSGGVLPLLPLNRKVGQDDSGILVGGERRTEIEFVWAARATSRAHFPRSFDEDPQSRPDCWSSSGQAPDPSVTEPKAKACAGCPFSFEATGGKKSLDGSPGCSKNLEALVYIDDAGMSRVARIRFGGIAYKAARDYWDSFRWGRPRKYAFQFLTRMRLVSVKTDNGNFLVPEFDRLAQLDDAEAVAIGTDARASMGSFTALVSEEIVDGTAREVASDDGLGDPFPSAGDGSTVDAATGEIHRSVPNRWEPSEEPF